MPELEHDPKLIRLLAQVHEGNAQAHSDLIGTNELNDNSDSVSPQRWSKHEMIAASSLVLAASCWTLVDQRKAVQLYRSAAERYQQMGHSYWIPLKVASSSDADIRETFFRLDDVRDPTPLAVAFGLLINAEQNRPAKVLNEHWRHMGNIPVGRLGIPLDHYGRVADAIRSARAEGGYVGFISACASFMGRISEVLSTASHDRFHWSRLQLTVFPAEPEAVAVAVIMSKISHSLYNVPISKMVDLDRHGSLLIELGELMHMAANDGHKRRY